MWEVGLPGELVGPQMGQKDWVLTRDPVLKWFLSFNNNNKFSIVFIENKKEKFPMVSDCHKLYIVNPHNGVYLPFYKVIYSMVWLPWHARPAWDWCPPSGTGTAPSLWPPCSGRWTAGVPGQRWNSWRYNYAQDCTCVFVFLQNAIHEHTWVFLIGWFCCIDFWNHKGSMVVC